jgi:hypothetical protein
VVDSRTTSAPGLSIAAAESVAALTAVRSGPSDSDSGVVDVAAAGVQALHGRGLHVITGHVQADPDGLLGQRKAHVAKPDDHDVHETDLLGAATFNRSVAAA